MGTRSSLLNQKMVGKSVIHKKITCDTRVDLVAVAAIWCECMNYKIALVS
jgi:hypothetical protein